MKSLLLAAGLGTRFRPQTDTLPKPALPFLNIPLAAYGLELAGTLDEKNIVVNTFHLPEKIHNLFLFDLRDHYRSVEFSNESEFIRGSGGGLHLAEKFFENENDLLMMNADEVFFPEDSSFLKKAFNAHQKNKNLATLIVTEHPLVGTKFGGVWVDDKNKILGFGKTPIPGAKKAYHFIGFQFLSKAVFQFLKSNQECNILYDGLQSAIHQGWICQAFPVAGDWFEIGNLQDYLIATESCLNILNQPDHRSYFWIKKMTQKYIPDFEIEKTPEAIIWKSKKESIPSNVQIKNFAVLGENIHWDANMTVDSSAIMKNSKLTQDVLKNLILSA